MFKSIFKLKKSEPEPVIVSLIEGTKSPATPCSEVSADEEIFNRVCKDLEDTPLEEWKAEKNIYSDTTTYSHEKYSYSIVKSWTLVFLRLAENDISLLYPWSRSLQDLIENKVKQMEEHKKKKMLYSCLYKSESFCTDSDLENMITEKILKDLHEHPYEEWEWDGEYYDTRKHKDLNYQLDVSPFRVTINFLAESFMTFSLCKENGNKIRELWLSQSAVYLDKKRIENEKREKLAKEKFLEIVKINEKRN